VDEVIEIHQGMIERYGGSPGIRDQGLLESAVAMPQAGFAEQYLHSSVFEMAAAYLFHIVNPTSRIGGVQRL
jgi:death-on-curing protein